MNIKKIICCLLIFILAGCSVNYDLTINEDYSINEKVVASERSKKLESLTKLKGDNATKYIYNNYKKNKDVFIKTIEKGDNTIATLTTSYDDIISYSNDFKSDIFEKVIIKKDGNIVTLTANQTMPLSKDTSYSYLYDDITIKITVPFKVIKSNADSVANNTHIWKINSNNNYKKIELKYDESSFKDKVTFKINDKIFNINYAIIIISGIILLLLIIAGIVVINNKKNNSF